jgi:hypothetical protein
MKDIRAQEVAQRLGCARFTGALRLPAHGPPHPAARPPGPKAALKRTHSKRWREDIPRPLIPRPTASVGWPCAPCAASRPALLVVIKTGEPQNCDILPCTQLAPKLRRVGLLLTNEEGLHHKNPPWRRVEQAIRALDTGTGNSFCCLSTPDNTYIQTLHGFNGYHLEWRITGPAEPGGYTHYRAGYPGGSVKAFELKKHNHINPGEHRDLLHLEDVVDSFRAFHRGAGQPAWLNWRPLDL